MSASMKRYRPSAGRLNNDAYRLVARLSTSTISDPGRAAGRSRMKRDPMWPSAPVMTMRIKDVDLGAGPGKQQGGGRELARIAGEADAGRFRRIQLECRLEDECVTRALHDGD